MRQKNTFFYSIRDYMKQQVRLGFSKNSNAPSLDKRFRLALKRVQLAYAMEG